MSNFILTDGMSGKAAPTFFAAGVIATGLLHGQPLIVGSAAGAHGPLARENAYYVVEYADTAPSGGEITLSNPERSFDSELASFYSKLLYAQHPLGAEFQAVLNDNLWDLYAE